MRPCETSGTNASSCSPPGAPPVPATSCATSSDRTLKDIGLTRSQIGSLFR